MERLPYTWEKEYYEGMMNLYPGGKESQATPNLFGRRLEAVVARGSSNFSNRAR